MLEIEFAGQEFLLGRLAVLIAPQSVDFILYLLLFFDGFGVETIGPLPGGDSEELFAGVKNFLVMNLDINV